MDLAIVVAFTAGAIVGVIAHLIALEIGYQRIDKREREARVQRRLDDIDECLTAIERRYRQIDFNVLEGAGGSFENEGK